MSWNKLSDKFPDRDDWFPVKLMEIDENGKFKQDGELTIASDYFTGFCFCFPNVVEWWDGELPPDLIKNTEEVSPEG